MIYNIPVTAEPYQEQTFDFNGIKIRLTLRFNSIGQCWVMDIYEPLTQQQICNGVSLVIGVPILYRNTRPYYFIVSDESGGELDPISLNALGNRCLLYIAAQANREG